MCFNIHRVTITEAQVKGTKKEERNLCYASIKLEFACDDQQLSTNTTNQIRSVRGLRLNKLIEGTSPIKLA